MHRLLRHAASILPLIGLATFTTGYSDCASSDDDTSATPTATPEPEATSTPSPTGNITCPNNSGWTVGLLYCTAEAPQGYFVVAPIRSKTTWLLDTVGHVIRTWDSAYVPGQSVHMTEEGKLLRTGMVSNKTFGAGGAGGVVQRFDFDGSLEWTYTYSSSTYLAHHDVAWLPNGNVLLVAWELFSTTDVQAMGRDATLIPSSGMWLEHIVEVEPSGATGGNIVWEWHVKDHLIQDKYSGKANYGVVGDHPELLDVNLNYSTSGVATTDWLHANSIEYNADTDQIMFSSRTMGEFYVIDHSTTTQEAAGHSGGTQGRGGDFLFRWGNPANYDRGTSADRVFFSQHNAHWIPEGLPGAGNIMVFNNGDKNYSRTWSSVDELVSPMAADGSWTFSGSSAWGPEALLSTWTADPVTSLFADRMSGASKLSTGGLIVSDGPNGDLLITNSSGDLVWEYLVPVSSSGVVTQGTSLPTGQNGSENQLFRADFIEVDSPALDGHDLTPGALLEAS